jgi:hypothetical protein
MSVALLNPYCTLAELCHELKKPVADATGDMLDQLHEAINNASRWVDDYTGRDYYLHDHSSTVLTIDEFDDIIFGNRLFLPYAPVITLSEVKLGTEVLVLDVDYANKSDELVCLYGEWGVVSPDTKVTLKGTFGYAQTGGDHSLVPTGLPGRIVLATRLVAASLSGHNRKEVVALDGTRTDMVDREISKTVYKLLGRRAPLML